MFRWYGCGAEQAISPPRPPSDPSLVAFLERLDKAIEEKDQRFILSIVHPDCEVSYGGFRGVEDFKEYWFAPVSPGRDFFEELRRALDMGGIWTEPSTAYAVPYTAMAPGEDEHGVRLGVLIAPEVNVRACPGLKGRLLDTLGYELVGLCNIKVPIAVDGLDWACVLLPEGGRGYVATKFLASPLGPRFLFRKVAGNWMLVSTIAGQ